MKEKIRQIIIDALRAAHESGMLPSEQFPDVIVDEPKLDAHGDFSTNIAMTSARIQKKSPRFIAEQILLHLRDSEDILEKSEIAGPGFINFFLKPTAWHPLLGKVLAEDLRYGSSDIGQRKRVQVEFVSANPTGPLHIGHGRGAAVGDTVANLLAFCGWDVQREYYINDSGKQIRTLGQSVYLRYGALFGKSDDFPEHCYQGDYIRELAEEIRQLHGDGLLSQDADSAIDLCARYAADEILKGIKTDLMQFGVTFDRWYSEQALFDSDQVAETLKHMEKEGHVYKSDGALWFSTSQFGDEKDRVVVRQNGQTTYFASDIAYHREKYRRGIERVIDVWGADHHGYIPRMRASLRAMGLRDEQFDVILVQLVNLLREGAPVAMSTRAGEFVTLKDVIDEVGTDAARFIFLTRHYDSPLDFDLALAKRQTNENPVYYVQYVHARISSIIRKAGEMGVAVPQWHQSIAASLCEKEEIDLLKCLSRYPETIRNAGILMEPHRVTFFLMELAAAFHAYYNMHRVLSEDSSLTQARLLLVRGVQLVIRNGLTLLGVSAPEKM